MAELERMESAGIARSVEGGVEVAGTRAFYEVVERTVPFTALEIVLRQAEGTAARQMITLDDLIRRMHAQGMSPEAITERLTKDLREGGPIFADFKRAVRATTRAATTQAHHAGSEAGFAEVLGKAAAKPQEAPAGVQEGTEGLLEETTLWYWVARLSKTCRDCMDRHGTALPMAVWRAQGLPGSGWSVCGDNCQCKLVPKQVLDEKGLGRRELFEPIKQAEVDERREGRPRVTHKELRNLNRKDTSGMTEEELKAHNRERGRLARILGTALQE